MGRAIRIIAGDVVATAELATDGSGSATFALGFGRTRDGRFQRGGRGADRAVSG